MYQRYIFAWKFLMNHRIWPRPSKNVISFLQRPVLESFKNLKWGSFVEADLCLVHFCQRIGKKLLKSSKLRLVRGVNDSNDMFFIQFDYRTVEKKTVFLIYLEPICIPTTYLNSDNWSQFLILNVDLLSSLLCMGLSVSHNCSNDLAFTSCLLQKRIKQ